MEELEAGEIEYETVEEFLMSLRKEFGGGEEELVKAAELRKLEQEGRSKKVRGKDFEGSNGEDQIREDKYSEGSNNRGIVGQWGNWVSHELRVR